MIAFVFCCLLVLPRHVFGFQEHCSCGYGGLCTYMNLPDCYYNEVGSGFYKWRDGMTFTDHCSKKDCGSGGKCVQIFGASFCDCPEDFYGESCEHHLEGLARFGFSNKVWIYYQVQTAPESDHTFTLVWDSRLIGDKTGGRYWADAAIDVSDHRHYTPFQSSFDVKNIKEICVKDAQRFPKYHDIRVCDLLPEGEVPTFTVDADLRIPLHRPEGLLVVPGRKEPVGRKGQITVTIVVTKNPSGEILTLFNRTFTVFTYLVSRVTHHCLVDFSFQGCETNYRWPTNHPRSARITIRPIVNLVNCTGGNIVGNKWTISENINSYKDAVRLERNLDLFDNKWALELAPTSLLPNTHRIGYILFIRGLPPVYGGTKVFVKTGQATVGTGEEESLTCFFTSHGLSAPGDSKRKFTPPHQHLDYSYQWRYHAVSCLSFIYFILNGQPQLQCFINVSVGSVDARIKGGHSRTSSCYTSLQLPIGVPNKGYKVSELHFLVSCNVPTDPECKETLFTVPVYTKLNNPCDTHYKFNITVLGRVKGQEGPKETLVADVQFVKSEMANYIDCIFNCYPIDPSYRVLAYVNSVPYSPRPVTWGWNFAGKEISKRDGVALAFHPLTSSRIFRVNGGRFIDGSKTRAEASVIVNVGGPLFVKKTLYTCNYLPLMKYFKLELASEIGPLYRYYWDVKGDSQLTNALLRYFPVTLRVYQIHTTIKGCIILNETSYHDEIYFTPSWRYVKLCVMDRVSTEGCTEPVMVQITNRDVITIEDLEYVLATGDSTSFLGQAVRFLYQGLWKSENEPMEWSISIEERIKFIKILLLVKHTRPLDQLFLSQITSLLYYSTEGNIEQRIHPFKDNNDDDFGSMMRWVELRKLTTKIFGLTNTLTKKWALSIKDHHFKLRFYYSGTMLDELFHTWSLGYFQAGYMMNFVNTMEVEYPEYLRAELNHHGRQISMLLDAGLHGFMLTLGRFTSLYYGLRSLGNDTTRGWSLTSSLAGLKVGLDRTFFRDKEQLPGFTDFFFGPSKGPEDWLEYAAIYLPQDSSLGFETEPLSFVVFAAKNRHADEASVSPDLYISLMRKNGSILHRFPGNDYYYHVTLPRMVQGKLDLSGRNAMDYYTMMIPDDSKLKQRYFPTYKVVFPAKYKNWHEFIYLESDLPIKAKITTDHLPDLSEVEMEPDLPVLVSNLTGSKYSVVNLTTRNGDGLPPYFYIGLWPGSTVPAGKVIGFSVSTQMDVCHSMDISGGDRREKCKGISVSEGNRVKINCQCSLLSAVIRAYSQEIRRVRLFATDIVITLPEEGNEGDMMKYDYITMAFLAGAIVIIFFFAAVKDCFRRRNHLNYLRDTYVNDSQLLVVGVYTSLRFLAGTVSNVAIKIEGTRSASRVHVLNAKHKTLFSMGDDNWFVLTTNKPLGKIRTLTMWTDFRCLSDWHCSHVYIYEVETSKWYFVDVNRWFSVSDGNESSRMARLPVVEVESVDGVFLALPYTFKTHFINEIRNTHTIASLFLLRQRSLTTSEQRAIMFVIKVLAMILMAWVVEDYGFYALYGKSLDPISSKSLITLDRTSLIMATVIAFLAIPFTFPLRLAYRVLYRSKLLQKKMTNPIYLQVASPDSLVITEERKVPPSLGRKRSLTKSAQKGKHIFSKDEQGSVNEIEQSNEPVKQGKENQKFAVSDNGGGELPGAKGFFRKRSISLARAFSRASRASQRVSRLFSIIGSDKEKGEKKKVVFIDDSSERKFSQRISQLVQTKIAWTRKTIRTGGLKWKIPLLHSFGPSLFHCVNVSEEAFLIKTRKRILKIRIFAALEILLLLSLIFLIMLNTNAELKLLTTGFLVLLAMILNAIIIEPGLIALNSVAMFYILKVTNKESYLWNEDHKAEKPSPLKYEEYLRTATKPQYKPLLTSSVTNKRQREAFWSTFKTICCYSVCFGAIFLSLRVLQHSYDAEHFYHVRKLFDMLSSENLHLERPSCSINNVIGPESALDYLRTSIADYGYDFYNGENISRDGSFWARDEFSKPIGAANMILKFISKGNEGARVTKLMEPYFETVYGYLSDGTPVTEPIHLGDHELHYMETSYGRILGKSRDTYELQGHNLTLPMIDYEQYYTTVLDVLGDLAIDRDSHIRVITLTYNFINPFDRRITTVDALAEFLPSGLATARLEIQTFFAYEDGERTITSYRRMVIFLVLIHLVFTAAAATKHEKGYKAYFCSLGGAVKLFIYPSNVMLWLADMLHHQHEALSKIVALSHDEYTDLHQVHNDNWWESILQLVVLNALVADTFIALWNAFGSDSLKQSLSFRCLRNCLCMFLLQIYIGLNAHICANVFDRHMASLEVIFFVREAVNIQTDEYNEVFLLVTIFVMLICSKACTATFIASYYLAEISHERRQHTLLRAIQDMYRTMPKPGRIIVRTPRLGKQHSPGKSSHVEWRKSKSSIKFSLLDGSVKKPGNSVSSSQ